MISIATANNNDIYTDVSGNLALVSQEEAVIQAVRHAVLTTLGELPLNKQAGVDYFNTIFCDSPDLESFRQSVQSAAEAVSGVQSVNDFLMQVQNGVLRYQMKITLTNGSEVTVNG